MAQHTPFHERTAALNETMLWEHWAGYVVARQYQYSVPFEYYAIRNAVGLFDTSPLFKYRIEGSDATPFLAKVLTRDIRNCAVGRAHYTVWCDREGFVYEDGVVLHLREDEYLLSCAGPNLRYLTELARGSDVNVIDLSTDYGILAVQGPHAFDVMKAAGIDSDLRYFDVIEATVAGVDLYLSRTGYSGDLGYELWVPAGEALTVWDAVMGAGAPFNIIPYGMDAMNIARTEAGMVQISVDFSSTRHAWIGADHETPLELGFGWMLQGLSEDDRAFVGRTAIEKEIKSGSSRWKTVGFEVDIDSYESLYNNEGLIAPKDGVLVLDTKSFYSGDWQVDESAEWVGYATSFMYSPILKRHIGLAKLQPDRATPGSEAFLELMLAHRPHYVLARVVETPFFNPKRKTARMKAPA